MATDSSHRVIRGKEVSPLFMPPTSKKFYAPNFEEVEEAYWFGPVHPSVRLCVTLALGQELLEIGS